MQRFLTLFSIFIACYAQAQNGNVGIGTASPAEKLHVVGNIKADTLKPNAFKLTADAATGKVLTSDAAGNATWQTATNTGTGSTNTNGNIGYGVWGDCATNGNISEYQPITDFTTYDKGKSLGYSVAISGNWMIVGAVADSGFCGSANVYRFDGTKWIFTQKLTDPNRKRNQQFGTSISISGGFAFIGCYNDWVSNGYGDGSCSIFKLNGASWIFLQKLTDPGAGLGARMGNAVAVSGNWAIVGLTNKKVGGNNRQGAVNLYQYDGNLWVIKQTLYDASGTEDEHFGYYISLSGNWLFVLTLGDVIDGIRQGSVFVYNLSGSNWGLTQKLHNSSGALGQGFGSSVSVSGEYAMVGASDDSANSTFVNTGAILFYKYDGSNWVVTQKYVSDHAAESEKLGYLVHLSGQYAIASKNSNSNAKPEVFIFIRQGDSWTKLQSISDPGGTNGDQFGNALAVDGATKRFVIGAAKAFPIPGYPITSSVPEQGKVVAGKIN